MSDDNLIKINGLITDIKSELDKKGERDVIAQEKLDKMSLALADMGKETQEAKAKAEAAEKAAAQLAAALDRVGAKGESKKSEIIEKSEKAFAKFLRSGDAGEFKTSDSGREIEIRAMSTENDPMGGYLVLPEMASFLVTRAFETTPMRTVANVVTTGSDRMTVLIDDDEAAARWVGEGASGGETDTPDVGMMSIYAHKIEAEPKATTEMLQDPYLSVESWLNNKLSDKFSRTENSAFVNGTGVNQPLGFLTLAKWASAGVYERNKLEQIALGNASALTADGLIDLQAALKEVYQPRATWFGKRQTYAKALQLKGSDNYFFGPTLLKDGQQELTLLGKRFVFADDMPAVGSNNLSVAYGDFSVGYTVMDRVGMTVLRDGFTSKGFVKFYTTKRVGGAVTNFDAIKIGKVATTV